MFTGYVQDRKKARDAWVVWGARSYNVQAGQYTLLGVPVTFLCVLDCERLKNHFCVILFAQDTALSVMMLSHTLGYVCLDIRSAGSLYCVSL